jgi:AraC family transcriptional regulator
MGKAATVSLLAQHRLQTQSALFRNAQLDARVAVALHLAHVGGTELWLARRSDIALALESAPARLTVLARVTDAAAYAIEGADPSAYRALKCVLGDTNVRALVSVLASSLGEPLHADGLFVELTIAALRARLDTLLRLRNPAPPRQGLAPWQERRACELLLMHLAGAPVLVEIAQACRLSLSHFKRAFRRSTGMPPYRWLTERRIEHSKQLLAQSPPRALADIALECGFSDQSHFTRTFARLAGATPGTWRRACGMPA